jgi:hypothetical protein
LFISDNVRCAICLGFAAGGADGIVSVPSNLRAFSPAIKGAGKTTTKTFTPPHKVPPQELNLAVSSTPIDEMDVQIDELVKRLESNDYGENWRNEWKMINLLVGGINMCRSCYKDFLVNETDGLGDADYPAFSANHRSSVAHYGETLDRLVSDIHARVPRVFLNVFTLLDPTPLHRSTRKYFYCRRVYQMGDLCGCVTDGGDENEPKRDAVRSLVAGYNGEIKRVAMEWQAKNLSDFTVNVARGLERINLSDFGMSFISNADW